VKREERKKARRKRVTGEKRFERRKKKNEPKSVDGRR
jgi:hypothetical protein